MMNSKIIGTHQPNYIPWMGYFYKISKCDVFVYLDDVQFSKTGSHNYHYIKTPKGSLRLKIPVKHGFIDPINKVITKDSGGWKMRHLEQIKENYNQAPLFTTIFPEFENLLLEDYDNLAELNINIIHFFIKKFNIGTKTIQSSELNLNNDLKGESRILEICKNLGATTYYSGRGAKAYQNEGNFKEIGVNLIYDDFTPIKYDQLWGDFISNVSVLDYVFNFGYEWNNYLQMLEVNKIS